MMCAEDEKELAYSFMVCYTELIRNGGTMREYIISCSSTIDLSTERARKRDLEYVCFHFSIDGKDYPDDMGNSMRPEELYQRMLNGAEVMTSQISVGDYEKHFRRFLEDGKDVLHVCLSSGISGTLNSAVIARDLLQEAYPERKIYVLDSLCASAGYGFFMEALADRRDEGKDIDEVYQWGKEHRFHVNHWFFTTDLTFFIKGGRVSKTAGFFGNVLHICPLLNVDREGKLVPREKIRTKKKVIRRCVDVMREKADNHENYSGKCYISHSDIDTALETAAMIEKSFPKLDGKVEIFPIGSTIGCHTGPGTVAVFFWGDKRVD